MVAASGLAVDISLMHMYDGAVRMSCSMKEAEDGSGGGTADLLPAEIYLIRDEATCNDLATAVGNEVNTEAVKLGDVTGLGEAVEKIPSVEWSEVRSTACLAVLKASGSRAAAAESRCPARSRSILVPALRGRVFGTLNLATYTLVGVGVASNLSVPPLQMFDSVSDSFISGNIFCRWLCCSGGLTGIPECGDQQQ